jgi:Glucosidase II beta subunit-like protein
VHFDSAKPGLELQSVTSLGKFASRKFQMAHQFGTLGDNDEFSPNNKYAEDEPELARVVDSFDNGDICEATGKPRHAHIKYFCCSERLRDKFKGPVIRNGHPVSSKIVSIVNLVEDPDVLCSYTITICTPLLCDEVKSDDDDGLLFDIVTETSRKRRSLVTPAATSNRHATTKKKENGTIRDVLDIAFGKACIQSNTAAGWWSYEYCHRKHIRQFHESIYINTETGRTSADTEDIYMLGFYNEDLDSYPDEDEWKYLVNTTLSLSGTSSDGSTGSKNGAGIGTQVASYLSVEYTGGDVCDDSDVTDAAIKAGSVGGGRIERACSVRYMCGSRFDVRVNEDHTCHYIVEVSIPDLCDHPLFKAPVAKKRVVKCVPVDDTDEWDI